jgi:hypothetical protein
VVDEVTGGIADTAPVEDTGSGRYMYAVCRGLDPSVLDGLAGLDGEPLELVRHQELAAIVSSVPLSEFGEDGLRRNLESLTWLEPVVRAHDEVVQAVAVAAPTAPMRLATICFDDTAVLARLREWYVALMHALDRVEGHAEWSVKVITAPRTQEVDPTEPVASGADYLRRKKAAAQERSAGDASAQAVVEQVHHELASMAAASRHLPAQDARLSGHQGTMVLNAAYLVRVEDADAFAARIDEVAAAHPELTVAGHGPWPPYSFAMLEQR